jgi:hypothetical protein
MISASAWRMRLACCHGLITQSQAAAKLQAEIGASPRCALAIRSFCLPGRALQPEQFRTAVSQGPAGDLSRALPPRRKWQADDAGALRRLPHSAERGWQISECIFPLYPRGPGAEDNNIHGRSCFSRRLT